MARLVGSVGDGARRRTFPIPTSSPLWCGKRAVGLVCEALELLSPARSSYQTASVRQSIMSRTGWLAIADRDSSLS